MEARRPLVATARLFVLLTVTAVLILCPAQAVAYENVGAHPKINELAVDRFVDRARGDAWLRSTSLNGEAVAGWAVTELGMLQIREEQQTKTVTGWISHGGMSADEPELPMSFRHFYDPLKWSGVTYLTDHLDDVLEWGWGLGGAAVKGVGYFMPLPDTENPKTDARYWALTHPDNRYTYEKAVEFYRTALAKAHVLGSNGRPAGGIVEYGQAWRAVGETMHLIADMTVPAHVRNDSHPYLGISVLKLGNPDPYESTIGSAEIAANAGGTPSPAVDYDATGLHDLFESVALWTNSNFFSTDTIPDQFIGGKTWNGQPEYPSPSVGDAEDGYYYLDIDGKKTPILAEPMLRTLGLVAPNVPLPCVLNWTVLQAQRSLLIPTAIEATSRVIDNFLPRLGAEFDAQLGVTAGTFKVTGRLLHEGTLVWPAAPEIRNGAYIEYEPKGAPIQTIWLPPEAYKDGNEVEHTLEAKPGDQVSLRWDIGGYVIISDPQLLRGVEITVLPDAIDNAETTEELQLRARVFDVPAGLAQLTIQWDFGDGTAPISATPQVTRGEMTHEVKHVYEKAGEYTAIVRVLHPASGENLGEVQVKIKVAERKIGLQVYPNSLKERAGWPVQASCLPASNSFRYEWVFGDGQQLAPEPGRSSVEHTYEHAGSYRLLVRLYDLVEKGGRLLAEDSIPVEITGGKGECPLCGQFHGELEKHEITNGYYYADAQRKRQCIFAVFYDKEQTKMRQTGVYVDHKKEGIWTTYRETGIKDLEDPYVAGVREGVYRTYDQQTGNLNSEYVYVAGHQDGPYTAWHDLTGIKYKQGIMVYFPELGASQRHGFHTEWWWQNGNKKAEGHYEHDKMEGHWVEYHANGTIAGEGSYHLGLRTGHWVEWSYESGQARRHEGPYVDGKKHGEWIEPHTLGYYWKGSYQNGLRKGLWTYYGPDGTARKTETY